MKYSFWVLETAVINMEKKPLDSRADYQLENTHTSTLNAPKIEICYVEPQEHHRICPQYSSVLTKDNIFDCYHDIA